MPIPSSISFVKEDYAKHLLKALKSSNQINEQNGSRKVIHACCEDSEKAVSLTNNRLTSVYMGSLYPGSRFYGSQKCGPGNYEVHVDILVSGERLYYKRADNSHNTTIAHRHGKQHTIWLSEDKRANK